jgi:hypothetical protein
MPQWELVDLRAVQSVNFMSGISADTMYFYNYDDPGHALVRANYKTGGRKRESTGIPLTSEYKIFAWERNIYFVRYDAGENKLYAAVHNDDGSKYIESYSGQRIENPVNFFPVGEYMVIESKSDTGNVLFGYDPIVSSVIDDKEVSLSIFPNPSNGKVFVKGIEGMLQSQTECSVYNANGDLVHAEIIADPTGHYIDLSGVPAGVYVLQLRNGDVLIGRDRLVLIK